MPLKIIEETSLIQSAGSITKAQIIELMDMYKKNTGKEKLGTGKYNDHQRDKNTTSAWFSLKEIIDFIVSNGVPLSPGADLSKYGIRVYFGMHHPDNSFQPVPYRNNTPMSKFKFLDTPILVLTERKGVDNEADMLSNGSFISIASFNPEEGLDNARLCPPECNGGMQ